ncbi:MAG: Crp/Fnr family transcriptional regulator [Oscillospiraceae bacterium]|nr:Crp/Fnr family transcriptional regulator [Oscillospiraceae bacterium]
MTELFYGIDKTSLDSMLHCIGAKTERVQKGEIILLAGGRPEYIGVVLAGQLHILREDYGGSRSLIAAITPGKIFAEALCCAGVAESPVTVIAHTDATVLLLPFRRIPSVCPNACAHHAKLIENMLRLTAEKNLLLQSRMEIISLKSVRAEVLRYLESFVPEQGRSIIVPFNREEMADYLCVERSALSHELAWMKRDGLIEYRKNCFVLKGD